MGLAQHDLKPFVGQWMRTGGQDGYCEGVLIGVSKTAIRLNPMITLLEGVPLIAETSTGVLALSALASVRVFPKAEAEALVARAQQQMAEARTAMQAQSPATAFVGQQSPHPGPYL